MRREDPNKWYIVTLPMVPQPVIVKGDKLLGCKFEHYLWLHQYCEMREATEMEIILYGQN